MVHRCCPFVSSGVVTLHASERGWFNSANSLFVRSIVGISAGFSRLSLDFFSCGYERDRQSSVGRSAACVTLNIYMVSSMYVCTCL